MESPSTSRPGNPADKRESSPLEKRLADDEFEREKSRRYAREANKKLDYAKDRDEATRRFLNTRAKDPFPEIQPSLLNSADIADYVSATGMILPFDSERLKTASYEVGLLGKWTYVDEHGMINRGELHKGERFILKRNSIAFMTAEPIFQLPDYIALRHNLKIGHVYKGLLVGTGPLIDPGFTGRISLPIHNLTESDYELVGGEGIIWVEFTKLSSNALWQPGSRPRIASRRRAKYVQFPPRKTRTKDVFEYINDATEHLPVPSSSSAKIATNASQALKKAKEARRLVTKNARFLTIAGVIALVGLAASLIGPVVVDLRGRTTQLEQELDQLRSDQQSSSTPTPTSSPGPTP